MKAVLSRVGSLMGLFALSAGVMAAACSAPPTGSVAGASQEQNDDDDDGKLPGTSTSTSPTQPGSNNNTPPANTPPSSTPAPADADASTPPPTGGQCAAEADMFACFDCCDAANPGGWEIAAQAFDDCACQQACAQACGGNYCQGGNPSAACIQCLDNAQQCEQAADTACQGNAACAAADACAQASACETKPEQ